MQKSVSTIIMQLIAAAWRRRVLLLTPMLVLLPLSILGAKFLPRTYVSTALMVMQESDRNNPFLKKSGVDYTLVKRINGLEAWLKSDHVLTQIFLPFRKYDPVSQPRLFKVELDEFRKSFYLELVGNDFLRFSLADHSPKNLGKKLEAITSRFLEGLLVPDTSVQSAGQLVLQSHHKMLMAIKAQRRQAERSYRAAAAKLDARTNSVLLKTQKKQLKKLRALYADNKNKLARLRMQQQHDGVMLENNVDAQKWRNADDEKKIKISSASDRIEVGALHGVGDMERQQAVLKIRINRLENSINSAMNTGGDLIQLEKRLAQMNQAEQLAQQKYDQSSLRLANVNVQSPLGILNAPEGIKIVDPPKDPVRPATSGLKIIAAGLLGAVFLGLGMAVLAELTDQRIFTAEETRELTGLRILGRLPNTRRTKRDKKTNGPKGGGGPPHKQALQTG